VSRSPIRPSLRPASADGEYARRPIARAARRDRRREQREQRHRKKSPRGQERLNHPLVRNRARADPIEVLQPSRQCRLAVTASGTLCTMAHRFPTSIARRSRPPGMPSRCGASSAACRFESGRRHSSAQSANLTRSGSIGVVRGIRFVRLVVVRLGLRTGSGRAALRW
jgi:hypothetical protein